MVRDPCEWRYGWRGRGISCRLLWSLPVITAYVWRQVNHQSKIRRSFSQDSNPGQLPFTYQSNDERDVA
jgi:hypothetical protein